MPETDTHDQVAFYFYMAVRLVNYCGKTLDVGKINIFCRTQRYSAIKYSPVITAVEKKI